MDHIQKKVDFLIVCNINMQISFQKKQRRFMRECFFVFFNYVKLSCHSRVSLVSTIKQFMLVSETDKKKVLSQPVSESHFQQAGQVEQ